MYATRSRKESGPIIDDLRKRKLVEDSDSEAEFSDLPSRDTSDADDDDGSL